MIAAVLFAFVLALNAGAAEENVSIDATIYTTRDGLAAGPVREVDVSPSGRPYARTSAGWFVLEGPLWKPAVDYQPPASLALAAPPGDDAGPVLASATRGDAAAAGCTRGLYVRDSPAASWKPVFLEDKLLQEVTAVAFDRAGRIWFAAHEGIGLVEGETARLIHTGRSFGRATCASGGRDAVWIGTERGLLYLDGERLHRIAGKAYLAEDHVTCLSMTSDGVLWIGTLGGVSRIRIRADR